MVDNYKSNKPKSTTIVRIQNNVKEKLNVYQFKWRQNTISKTIEILLEENDRLTRKTENQDKLIEIQMNTIDKQTKRIRELEIPIIKESVLLEKRDLLND